MAEHQTSTIDIDATAAELFAIVTDLESYPDWVENIQSVEVHESSPDGLASRATMTVDTSFKVITYTLSYEYDYPSLVSWASEEGSDVKQLDGSYRFEPNDEGGTTVTYDLTLDTGFPVPGFMVRKAQRAIMSTALEGLKEQAEDT